MRRLLIALCLMAGPVFAQDYMTNTPSFWCYTNALNTSSVWVNAGSAGTNFTQHVSSNAPTLAADGTYYTFPSGHSMTTTAVLVNDETNQMAISLWFQEITAGGNIFLVNNVLVGKSSGFDIENEAGPGNLRVGVRGANAATWNYRSTTSSDTVSFHHIYMTYRWYSGGETGCVRFWMDGIEQTTVYLGSSGPMEASAGDVVAIGQNTADTITWGSNHKMADIRIWTNMVMTEPTYSGLVFTNGMNFYDPPGAPPPASAARRRQPGVI